MEQLRARPAQGEERSASLVGCGRPLIDQDIRIIDPQDLNACAPGVIGEICVSSPSVAAGYWQRPEESAEAFVILDGGARYLRTGDLGFLHEGELYIAGRCKDLIIVRGQNYYPQDIELAAERAHWAVRAGSCAAVTIAINREDRLGVICELRKEYAETVSLVADAVREAVFRQCDVTVDAVVLIEPGTILKTTSGKIRRSACVSAYQSGELCILHERPPRSRRAPWATCRADGLAGWCFFTPGGNTPSLADCLCSKRRSRGLED